MFRILSNLRTFRSSRILAPYRHPFIRHRGFIPRHNGEFSVRRVRIIRPLVTKRRVMTASFYTIFLGGFFWYFIWSDNASEDSSPTIDDIKIVAKEVKAVTDKKKVGPDGEEASETEAKQEASVNSKEEEQLVPEEQPEGAWFIPIGWPHKLPRTYYKGDDPEWQAFMALSKDRQRGLRVRRQLAGIVGTYVSQVKGFQKFLGKDIKPGKYWLDVDYPEGPPPEYECTGIEVTDDYIAWTVRPVSPLNVSRLQNATWPTATFHSLYATTWAYWQIQLAKAKKALNMEAGIETPESRYPPGLQGLPRVRGPLESSSNGNPSQEHESKSTQGKASTTPVPTGVDLNKPGILRPLPAIPQPDTEMNIVSSVFKHTLARKWKRASAPPPRGTIMVSGMVEVFGSKGMCTLDVHAAYNPRESTWESVALGIRRIQPREQRPRGDTKR